jgi:hypothetical protein
MADTQSPARQVASAVIFFVIVALFQLLFEWIFGDAIDARYLVQVAIASVIMTLLFTVFTRRRLRR